MNYKSTDDHYRINLLIIRECFSAFQGYTDSKMATFYGYLEVSTETYTNIVTLHNPSRNARRQIKEKLMAVGIDERYLNDNETKLFSFSEDIVARCQKCIDSDEKDQTFHADMKKLILLEASNLFLCYKNPGKKGTADIDRLFLACIKIGNKKEIGMTDSFYRASVLLHKIVNEDVNISFSDIASPEYTEFITELLETIPLHKEALLAIYNIREKPTARENILGYMAAISLNCQKMQEIKWQSGDIDLENCIKTLNDISSLTAQILEAIKNGIITS